MKIKILCENSVKHASSSDPQKNCLAEHGFSVYLQGGNVDVLYDTGHTDVYWRNAGVMGIDLENADFVVLSHYHWDHTGGLQNHRFTSKKRLVLHPKILEKLPLGETRKIRDDFEIVESTDVLEFSDGMFFLGEIPRVSFEKGSYKNDPMLDDSAMVVKTSNGIIVIVGCSHSGIRNICEYAKKVTGQKLFAVIGGFHLSGSDAEVVERTIEYFKNEKVPHIYPMHCVDFPAMVRFHEALGAQKLSVGDEIEFVI
ncbi:MAG: MBL fold metallo-hydrolase [Candidatus Gracilibacteria bacterium]